MEFRKIAFVLIAFVMASPIFTLNAQENLNFPLPIYTSIKSTDAENVAFEEDAKFFIHECGTEIEIDSSEFNELFHIEGSKCNRKDEVETIKQVDIRLSDVPAKIIISFSSSKPCTINIAYETKEIISDEFSHEFEFEKQKDKAATSHIGYKPINTDPDLKPRNPYNNQPYE
jgi:hypothetical protein